MNKNKPKIFLIFASNFIGDTLIVNGLVQNIKENFMNSKVVFIVPEFLYPIAKYQYGVDDVIIFNQNKKNNILYLISFILNFKYKFPYCSFSINSKERDLLIAKFICSKNIYASKVNRLAVRLLTNTNNNKRTAYKSMLGNYSAFIEPMIKKNINIKPIIFNPPIIPSENTDYVNEIKKHNEIITIIPSNGRNGSSKNMPITDFSKLIDNIDKKYTILLIGKGDFYTEYVDVLKQKKKNFIDLTNKLSLLEVANIFKISKIILSIDTGLMHLSYSMGCKTIALFYEKSLTTLWAPDENIYNDVIVLSKNINTELILNSIERLEKNIHTT